MTSLYGVDHLNRIQVRYRAALRATEVMSASYYVCCGALYQLTSLVHCGFHRLVRRR